MRHKRKFVVLFSIMISMCLVILFGFLKDYYDDNHIRHGTPYTRVGVVKTSEAKIMVEKYLFITRYISKCRIFPGTIKNIFDKIQSQYSDCQPELNPSDNIELFNNRMPVDDLKKYIPWIDPWGRPYQIRYNRERRILQVRSQGRYLWTELDDIIGETTWGMAGSIFNDEIKRCDSLPKNDMSCIFNRGWH